MADDPPSSEKSSPIVEEPDNLNDVRRPDVKIHVKRGQTLAMQTEGMMLTAIDAAVQHEADYSVTLLEKKELPPLPQGMMNMTAATAGYRLLPGGEHFLPYAELRMAYDPERLPEGYTPDDIYTSFYDTATLVWVRLERVGVDTIHHEIVSLTTHFTDFINELLKAPEMPETQAFVPTMMSDLEAVNPMEGLSLFQPPVSNQEGTANLSYPIWTPKGRNGMQPSLVLTYSSGGGNGWLGVGWDLSVPSVSLDTRWGVPRYSGVEETEIYLLCGEQLVNRDADGTVIPLPHRTNQQRSRMTGDVRFYARTGDAHDSIVRHGDTPSDYWWEVTDRNGTTHYYGHYPTGGLNALVPSTLTDERGNIARWMLCESRDPDSNWVRYFYEVDTTAGTNQGRQIYLDSIVYTGNKEEDGVYNVSFTRKDRSSDDIPVSCSLGFKEETARQLCLVTVRMMDSVITAYHFETECSYRSNFKTRLTAVEKIDNPFGAAGFWSHLKGLCANGVLDIPCGLTRQEFGYFDAPGIDTLFGPPQTSIDTTDSLAGFMFTPRYRIDSVNRATALGLSHSSSWSVGGTLGVGLGPVVSLTSQSVGGNYHRGKTASESLLTLVDLDGDGLADKVFVKGGKMYWRKQILLPDRSVSYGETHLITGASRFLVEGGTSNTVGVQASVQPVASGSGAWTESTSTTSTYFADVDGDGLTDIVDNGSVLFNRLVSGQPTFTRYQSQPSSGNGQAVSDPPGAASSSCGGIVFDGEVDDSVGCRVVWSIYEADGPMSKEQALSRCYYFQSDGIIFWAFARKGIGGYYVHYYRGRVDCSRRDLAMDGVPATEAVRVWVAPDSGTATVSSWVKLIEDGSDRRAMSRHADGITYTIQHSQDISVVGDTLRSAKDTLLMSRRICADCYRDDVFGNEDYDTSISNVTVKKGDLLFFRLQSGDDKQYDNVEDHIKITLAGRDYLSDSGFLLTEDKHFQAPYDGEYWIDGTCSISDGSVSLDIQQPAGAGHFGSGALGWHGNISKDSTIRIVLNTTDTGADWSGVKVRARIRFRSDSLPDTITVWTPGDKQVIHTSGSIWGDPVYQSLFGRLYDGWGQFAYHPVGNNIGSPLIRPGCLVLPAQELSGRVSDTNGLRDRIYNPVPDSGFSQQTMDVFTDSFGCQYSIISDSSCWVPMAADAQHSRWVSFGAQSSIGPDTMSNSLHDGWYSIAGQVSEDSAAYLATDVDYDDAVPVQTDGTPVKAVRKVNRSGNQSYTLGTGVTSESYSNGRSSIEMDYIDLNGDRYPDIVGPGFVQYRSQWGGLGEKRALPPDMADVTTSETNSAGLSFGASPVRHERVISGNPARAKFSLSGDGSLGGDISAGWDHAVGSWTDINGDGLPDYTTRDGHVRLNIGYDFLDTEDWDFDGVHSGQSASASVSFGSSAGLEKFNVVQGSIELGAGLSRSANRTGRTFMDINGDGLPDMVWRQLVEIHDWSEILAPTDFVHVKFNLGGGRWSQTYDLDIGDFNWSESYNESLNAGVTLGMTFFGLFKATAGLSGTPYSSSVSRDRMQLVDVDGDGLPDLVTSGSEGELTVRHHSGGKTNLLKSVTNFTGSSIHLDYTLSEPDCNQPSRSWMLTQVATHDPLNPNGGDTSVTRFAYSGPHYDRLERASYGYGTVVTEQIDPSTNTVYRTVRRDFHNGDILFKGRPKRELTCDGQGNRYIEKVYQYDYAAYDGSNDIDTCSGNAYSLRDRIVTRFYEGSQNPRLTTAEAYEYDSRHNVTKYIDEGDTAYSDDGLYIVLTYLAGQLHNLIGLRDSYKVYATGTSGTGWMRHSSFQYTPKGRLERETLHDIQGTSVFDFGYDSYGNLIRARKPQNDSLQRMEYLYTYDSCTHTYPVKIKNSHHDSVMTSYLLPFGKPTQVTDPSGSVMRYTYDNIGRLVSVTSPLNGSGTQSLVNEYCPVNYYNLVMPSTFGLSSRPYAVTTHYDDQGGLITRTAVITDGFGRVIQTKKGITSGGQQKMQVSGREFTDAFGRTTGRHDPFCENPGGTIGHFNPAVTMLMDTILYDVLDRETEVRQPSMNYTTTKQYAVLNDATGRRRFTTAITDPNGHTTVQYADYDGRRVQVTDALGGVTKMTYDALGQILSATDPEGFSTTYSYDKLGRLTGRVHPDAGTTLYCYDAAGNITKESNPLGTIFYDYTYERLAEKRYSNIVENSVTYTYGTSGTGRGRPIRIEDGTGIRELSYDALGNVTGEVRTMALPGTDRVYSFVTGYVYDSWGRMQTLTYPDSEKVTYVYRWGGDLYAMYGSKDSAQYSYVSSVTYNDFGQRNRIDYGNGTRAEYGYDALHRLSLLRSVSTSSIMQQISYATDGVGNIESVTNTAPAVAGMGDTYNNRHSYDALNRLYHSNESSLRYDMLMGYSASGRLGHKMINSQGTFPVNSDAFYGYCAESHPHAPKRVYDQNRQTLTELIWDEAGNLGQVNTAKRMAYDDSRFLFWTEDNRLHTVADYKWHSYYAYDCNGERTLKLTGSNTVLDVNADFMLTACILDNATLYPSPFVVASNKGYTKHYYVGSDRLCARIGGGGAPVISHDSTLTDKADRLYSSCQNQSDERHLENDNLECIRGLVWDDDILRRRLKDTPSRLMSAPEFDLSSFDDIMLYYANHNDPETEVYFYHSDHLGSASWITDATGMPVQHLQYLPYGEQYVDQRASGYHERFTFTGKEKDEETGYGYFGARYMDHELMTMWLSVDPMADKYPSISPYAYCAWNPMKLVDTDGKEFTVWIEDGEGNTYEYKPNMAPTGDAAAQQQIQTLNKMYSTSLGQEVIDVLIESGNDYYITNESTRTPGTSVTVKYGNGAKCKMGGNNTLLGISHELFHAFQYENCQGGATYKNEVEAYLYSNALVMEAGVPSIYQLGTLNPGTPDGDKFEKAMENLSGTSFSQTDFSTAVDLFQSQSRMNGSGTYNASYYTKGDPSNGSLLQQFYPLRR